MNGGSSAVTNANVLFVAEQVDIAGTSVALAMEPDGATYIAPIKSNRSDFELHHNRPGHQYGHQKSYPGLSGVMQD